MIGLYFGIFFRLMVKLHYDHAALLFFKVGYQKNSNAVNVCKDKKRRPSGPVLN